MLCLVIGGYSYPIYAMNKCYGLVTATIPQTSKGILGNFRLDKKYGLRDYLAHYIAFDKQITIGSARGQDHDTTKKAYEQFLYHNSADAVLHTLNNNIIDKDYALNALYFTHTVAREFQENIEYNQYFAHKYSGDAEQYIWVDNDAFSSERHVLLKKIKEEQKTIVKLVDFLQQRPLNKEYPAQSCGSIFKKEESSKDWLFSAFPNFIMPEKIVPATVAQTWNGILGNFVLHDKQPYRSNRTIQDYLQKYIARNVQTPEKEIVQVTFLDIKKAFELFAHHNHPDAIARDFEDRKITKQHAKDALEFTFWVIRALENYLVNVQDDSYEMELFDLFWLIERMKEKGYDMKFMEYGEWNSHIRE